MKRAIQIMCAAAACVSLVSAASAADIDWTRQLGSSNTDYGNGVSVDGSGNAYVTGYTNGDLDGNTSAGGYDLFLTKYSTSGAKQWTKQLGTSFTDRAYGVSVDSSGNAYVTGYTSGGLDGNTGAGGYDIFLTKYNTAGAKQWTEQLGTSVNDFARGVSVDSSGNAYVTGYTVGGLDGNTNAGDKDMFLAKYNTSGVKQWTRQLGSVASDDGNGVAVDSSGNAYVTGYTVGDLDGNTSAGGYDMFLTKYNTAGAKQWTEQLGSSAFEYAYGVSVDSSGNAYVTGYTNVGFDGNTSAGGNDMFLTKYSTSGAKQWTEQLGSSSHEYARGVSVDSSGSAYVAGYTSGGLDGNTNAGGDDIFLTKYDTDGAKQWTEQLGTSTGEYGMGVSVDSGGNVCYVTGYTFGDLDGNASAGGADMFLTKYIVLEPATQITDPATDLQNGLPLETATVSPGGDDKIGGLHGIWLRGDGVGGDPDYRWSISGGPEALPDTLLATLGDTDLDGSLDDYFLTFADLADAGARDRAETSSYTLRLEALDSGGLPIGGSESEISLLVPEPATLSLLALGGLTVLRKRCRRS
ncbi:MAG: SBBP repeat-containing protein [Phycisphaerae bacterium]|nr:SBBP repeat-containing protein [Phycisphaerae bacterium]